MSALAVENLRRCLDCGRCTSACPVARHAPALSPRRLVRELAAGAGGDGRGATASAGEDGSAARAAAEAAALWACLTCGQCDGGCPQQITIAAAIPALRRRERQAGRLPRPTRCAALTQVAVLQSRGPLPQDRLGWLPRDVRTDPAGRTLLWVGCAPYFDVFYADRGVRATDAAVAAIRLLNALEIAPALLPQERCCGHDAFWAGDRETFDRLAGLNEGPLREAAPETVVTLCPECRQVLDGEYRRRGLLPATTAVLHLSELLAERAAELPLRPAAAGDPAVTYHDPCRLGRLAGRYDPPRRALAAVPGLQLREMPRARAAAPCCAGSFTSCDGVARRLQEDRLREAAATGAAVLATACPKCLIHLKCAQAGAAPEATLEILDLAQIVAGALNDRERR